MSPDSEGLGAAVKAGVGSNLTQRNTLYTLFSEVLASVMITSLYLVMLFKDVYPYYHLVSKQYNSTYIMV